MELAGSVLDPDPPSCLDAARGQGRSSLVAALGLYDLMLGAEGASVVMVATTSGQASIVFGAAGHMVKLPPELAARVQVYQDRLVVPAVVNGTVTHSGDPQLARHIGNATVRTDNGGTRIYKEHKHATRRIDLAVCAIMAHSAAAAVEPGLQLYRYQSI